MNRFDQRPNEPYGKCLDCEEVFPDREVMSAHMSDTRKAGRGHRAQVTNPTRSERIENELQNLADDAMNDFVYSVEDLLDDANHDEITEAMSRLFDGDYASAWAKR